MNIEIEDQWNENDMEDVFYGGEMIQAPASSLEEADNLTHNIIMAQKRITAAEEYAKKMKAKVDEWLEKTVDDDQVQINTLMAMLVPWARIEILDRRKKSIDLMDGTVGFRRKQGKTVDEDKEATIEWYKKHWPLYVKESTVFKLDVKAAKEFYREKGEKAPTIEFQEPSDVPYVSEKI
ncbi:MAG: hypothetical protein DRZ90_14310 [Spirochaetes bacterium]|nr:MAG: hypothetical protein DRZ90_14310 [Spirochaetota bacterium]